MKIYRPASAHPPRAVIWASIASTRTLDDGFLLFAIIIVVIASRVPVLQFLITNRSYYVQNGVAR